jgi:DNA modification methylase
LAKIETNKTELVWPGKYDEDGTLKEVPRVSLPFQVIERVNESRATREAKGATQVSLFDVWEGKEGDTFEEGWRNKLIWGDNLLVMDSLVEKFAGKIDLIYIDPPFATGADFSFRTEIGETNLEVNKDASAIEEKAYRDTWGRGIDSYLGMLHERLQIMRDLLAPHGSIYVHIDPNLGAHLKLILDEVFGSDNFVNQIIWKRSPGKSGAFGGISQFGRIHEIILFYSKSDSWVWNQQFVPYDDQYLEGFYKHVEPTSGRRFRLDNLTAAGSRRGASGGPLVVNGHVVHLAPGRHWALGLKPGESVQDAMDRLVKEGRIWHEPGKMAAYKRYLDEMPGVMLQDIWTDIRPVPAQGIERLNFETQKPEALLERIVRTSSNEGGLVADLFVGSGTSLAVAEKLGRRWIGCDISRFAMHISRKRLLDIHDCRPFEVLNLGKYERQYWQAATFGDRRRTITERALYEYLAFILRLYGAQPVTGLQHLHGKKGRAMVHTGPVDAPVTIDEINLALDECAKLKQPELHVLGWEWEMGLAGPNNDYRKGGLMHEVARQKGVKLLLLQIPREVMEEQAVAKGDVQFFELAYLNVEIKTPRKLTVTVTFKDFVIPNTELIPEDVREKVRKWSDYVDYWAVDWNFQNDAFMQGWVTYRTQKDRSLALASAPHTYEKSGRYRILVKVIDIFGNDTSQAHDVEVG